MIYTLSKDKKSPGFLASLGRMRPYLSGEGARLILAFVAIMFSSAATLLGPYVVGKTIDTSIRLGDFHGVFVRAGILLLVFVVGVGAGYAQTIVMGGVGRRLLFNLRNALFKKLSNLPLSFFKQNKTGDLISRINNDTDKLNQFFSQGLMQFVGSFFQIVGAGIFLLFLNTKLALLALVPALVVIVATRFLTPWIKRRSKKSLETTGLMSAEVEESLYHFRVIVAFNRLDYFRERFARANRANYKASTSAGVASGILTPLYGLASSIAQLMVIAFGILFLSHGVITIGLLVGFVLYANVFYTPLRQLAALVSSFELAMAALDRVSDVLSLESDLVIVPSEHVENHASESALLEFRDVDFHYSDSDQVILQDVNMILERGKTYALVGPTGGGKTTTAGLAARLFDPSKGTVYLEGRDIRSYADEDRTHKIGYILQEPFLSTGTIKDNLVYGHPTLADASDAEVMKALSSLGLDELMTRFKGGLLTKIASGADTLSLGERQIIAFMRAVLRQPDLLILDEATANIDTVTEQVLESILQKLPRGTTKVIIAHRLNTIKNADEIYFVSGIHVTKAGSFEKALDLILHGKRTS